MPRGTLGWAADDLRKLWNAGTVSALSDAQLLERINADQDEHAFDAPIARHGPLVWSVCRSILRDRHDVEDAFQASFLILAAEGTIASRRRFAVRLALSRQLSGGPGGESPAPATTDPRTLAP